MEDKILEEIKSRLDIVDFISDYVDLKKAGQNYKGLCPFHSEKTPSFIVSPDKQIYHCFGCGEGGNIFSFIMRHDNITFPEAVKILARRAGVNIRVMKEKTSEEGLRYKLIELNRESLKVFQENLKKSKEATVYLEKRGIDTETIKTFSIGYSVKSWSYLYNHLKAKGFPDSLMLQAGLVVQGEKGLHDIFRGRIIFPIKNIQGEVIAFGGRVMDDSMPKYLNSPDTVIFKKGENLYGLDIAREEIRKKGFVIITEGYLDVITSHQKGFSNTVAPLGTALTEAHLLRLKRFAKRAIVVFDGDEAGKAAARRSIPVFFGQGFQMRVLLLPEGEDPDSFLRKNDPDVFKDALSIAKTPLSFLFDSSVLDRTETTREAIEMISKVRDLLLREELLRELSELSGFREMSLRAELKRISAEKPDRKAQDMRGKGLNNTISNRRYDEEVLLLSSVIAFPERINEILEEVPLNNFRNIIVRGILKRLGEGESIEKAMITMKDDEKTLISRLTLEPGFDIHNVDKNIKDCIKTIKGRIIKNSLREIQERIREAERTGQENKLRALLMEKQRILRDAAHLKCTIQDT
ncbi:MAG: DNA primase [Thermodesulfovibrionales bacterium]